MKITIPRCVVAAVVLRQQVFLFCTRYADPSSVSVAIAQVVEELVPLQNLLLHCDIALWTEVDQVPFQILPLSRVYYTTQMRSPMGFAAVNILAPIDAAFFTNVDATLQTWQSFGCIAHCIPDPHFDRLIKRCARANATTKCTTPVVIATPVRSFEILPHLQTTAVAQAVPHQPLKAACDRSAARMTGQSEVVKIRCRDEGAEACDDRILREEVSEDWHYAAVLRSKRGFADCNVDVREELRK